MREPEHDCSLCPRLARFRDTNRDTFAGWHNAPVPSFGGADATLLIVGLAPGLRGANRTGRPFTGDFAGDLLYPTLLKFGLAEGEYQADPEDGLRLIRCRITNAVRCVPPGNRPTGPEIAACRQFLAAELKALPELRVILALGTVAHGAALAALGEKKSRYPFRHGAIHDTGRAPLLADSYHCSRYNTSTGRLTPAMFEAVVADVTALLVG